MSQRAARAGRHSPSPVPAGTATGVALVLATVCIWGLQFPIAKSAFIHVDPFNLAMIRYGFPVSLLIAFLVYSEGIGALRFDSRAKHATIVGLIGMCGSPTLVFGGLSMTRPEIAAIIIAIQPLLTAIVLWVLRGMRPDGSTLLCIGVAFVGVFTVITGWSMEFASEPKEVMGDILIFLGALCWVYYTISGERFRDWSVLRYTSLTMLPGALGHVGVVLSLTLCGYLAVPGFDQWLAAGPQVLFLSLLGVLAAMLMWNGGTKRIGPLNAMLFINLIPVITFAVRYWQGARFTWLEIGGAGLVVLALIANNLVQRARNRRLRHEQRA